MPTIDVGDNDKVFVFTRSAESTPPNPKVTELGKNDMMVVIERSDPSEDGLQCVPKIMIYVGGEPIGLIQEFNLNASAKEAIARIEVKILSSEIEGLSDNLKTRANKYLDLLKRLIPFVNIKEIGFNNELLHEQGLSVDPGVPLGDG